jgi:hypothetical protein
VRSKGFVVGFNKTAGVVSSIGSAVAKGAKKVLSFNNVATGLGAVMEGANGMKKMTDAATRM